MLDDKYYHIAPSIDVDAINRLINDPSIKPWVCGDLGGFLDVSTLVDNPENLFFVAEFGGASLIKIKPKTYELHTFVLPEGRGRWAKQKLRYIFQWMFDHTDVEDIITLCPTNNRMAIGAARMSGFKKYGIIEQAWNHENIKYDIDCYIFKKEQF